MFLFVLILVSMVTISFVLSVIEAVLLSIPPSYVDELVREHPKQGQQLRMLKEKVARPLAVVLTLKHGLLLTAHGALATQAKTIFEESHMQVFFWVLQIISLVLSEIVPKTIGAIHWSRLAPLVTRVLVLMTIFMKPRIGHY